MEVLFIGGTGNISTSVSRLAVQRGIDLYLLNRGNHPVKIEGATTIQGDIAFHIGIRRTLDWFQADEKRMEVPPEHEQFIDNLLAVYQNR
jgi:nucleoside-diphosphate-sugar epimerase